MLKYLLVFISFTAFSQQETVDSLLAIFNSKQHDTIRLSALNELSINSNPPENDIYNNKLIALAEAKLRSVPKKSVLYKRYLSLVIEGYYNKAVYLSDRSQKDSAIIYYDKCVTLDANNENTELVGYCQISKGGILTNRGMHKEAIALFYKALASFEKTKSLEGIGDTYLYIGRLYHVQQNYPLAIEYLKKAYASFQSINNPYLLIDVLNKLGLVHISNKNYNEAVKYFNLCIDLSNKHKISNSFAEESLNYSLAFLHYTQSDFEKAEFYLKKSIALAIQANNLDVLSNRYHLMAKINLKLHRSKEAIVYAKKALEIETKEKDIDEQMKYALLLVDAYKSSKNYQLALEYYQLATVLRDSLIKAESKKQVVEAKLKYEFEKKEYILKTKHENEIIKLNSILELKNTQRRFWMAILIASLVIVVLVSMFLYKQQKQKNIIEIQNSSLLQQKMLLSQMNPHFIFNAINSIQNYILDKNEKDAYNYLAKFSRLIRKVLNNSKHQRITLKEEIETLNLYVAIEQLRFENGFDFELSVGKEIDESIVTIPTMIIQPFVENSIWHGINNLNGKRRGRIEVKIKKENDSLVIEVEDNGVGRELASKYKKNDVHQSEGLNNTEKRIALSNQWFHGADSAPYFEDIINTADEVVGTRVIIRLKIH